MDTQLTKVERHGQASATQKADNEKDTIVQDTNTGDKEETEHQKEGGDDSTLNYGIYDPSDLEEDLDTSFYSIVRRNLAPPTTHNKDWRRTDIFQMLVRCGDKIKG